MNYKYTLTKNDFRILNTGAKKNSSTKNLIKRFYTLRFVKKLNRITTKYDIEITTMGFYLNNYKTLKEFKYITAFEILENKLILIKFINNTTIALPLRIFKSEDEKNYVLEKIKTIQIENLKRLEMEDALKTTQPKSLDTNKDVAWETYVKSPVFKLTKNLEFLNPLTKNYLAIISIIITFTGIFITAIYNAIIQFDLYPTEHGILLTNIIGWSVCILGIIIVPTYRIYINSKLKNIPTGTFNYKMHLTNKTLSISYGDITTSYKTKDILGFKFSNLGYKIYLKETKQIKILHILKLGAYPSECALLVEKLKSITKENDQKLLLSTYFKKLALRRKILIALEIALIVILLNIDNITISFIRYFMPHYFNGLVTTRSFTELFKFVHQNIPPTNSMYSA